MKFLIVSHSFPPSNAPAAQRPYHMYKYLTSLGVTCKVICPESIEGNLGSSNWANVDIKDIIRTGYPDFAKKIIFNRTASSKVSKKSLKSSRFISKIITRVQKEILFPDKAKFWFNEGLTNALNYCDKDTVVYSTSPSVVNHKIALELKKETKCKWIADFRDFYYNENLINSDLIRKRWDKNLEMRIISQADAITFISDMMRDSYSKKYNTFKNKMYSVYNGFDPTEFPDNYFGNLDNKQINIFYAGTFYKGVRSPEPLLSALDELVLRTKIDNISIDIAGRIDQSIIDLCSKYESAKFINWLGLIPRKDVLKKMSSSHLNWLIIGEEKHHYYGFPIKGYEYIGARRPILCFSPKKSEAENIIDGLKIGDILPNLLDSNTIFNTSKILEKYYYQFMQNQLLEPLNISKNINRYRRDTQAKQLFKIANEL